MRVIVSITRLMLLRAFGMATRPVIVPGMVAGAVIVSGVIVCMTRAGPLPGLDLELAQSRDDRRLVDVLRVIFDADDARGAGIGLQHAWHPGQGFADGAGAAFVADALDLPCCMAVSPADLCAGRAHHLPHARQRKRPAIEMDAELWRRVAIGGEDMHALDTGFRAQRRDEAADTGIGRVGHLGQKDGNIEFELVGHHAFSAPVLVSARASRDWTGPKPTQHFVSLR